MNAVEHAAAAARADLVRARAARDVEVYARAAMTESPLFGAETALRYALGYAELVDEVPDAENVARLRGVFEGLRSAGALPPAP